MTSGLPGELLARAAEDRDLEDVQRAMYPILWAMARDMPSPTPMPDKPPFVPGRRMLFEGPGTDPGTTMFALRGTDVVGITITTLKENGAGCTNFTGGSCVRSAARASRSP